MIHEAGLLVHKHTTKDDWFYAQHNDQLTIHGQPNRYGATTLGFLNPFSSTCSTLYFGHINCLCTSKHCDTIMNEIKVWMTKPYVAGGAQYTELMCTLPVYSYTSVHDAFIRKHGFVPLGESFNNRRTGSQLQHYVWRLPPLTYEEQNQDNDDDDDEMF